MQGTTLNPKFEWDWGFRIGAGWDTGCCWGIGVDWVRYNTSSHNRVHAPAGGELHPIWPDPGPTVGDALLAFADWGLHLNMVDLMLNRPICVGNCFEITPAIGLRSAWVRQNYTQRFREVMSPATDIDLNVKCDFWGIGPAAQFGVHWWLWRGLGVYGDGGVSLLYGSFETASAEVRGGSLLKAMRDNFHVSRPVLDLTIGFDWSCVWRDCYTINLFVGWEHHYFFAQNMFARFLNAPSTGSFIHSQGALSTQGVTFGAKLAF